MTDFKKFNSDISKQSAKRLIKQFINDDVWENIQIYAANKKYSTDEFPGCKAKPVELKLKGKNPNRYYEGTGFDPKSQYKYAIRSGIVINCEGPLLAIINRSDKGAQYLYDLSAKYFHEYGLYLERVNAYTIALQRI